MRVGFEEVERPTSPAVATAEALDTSMRDTTSPKRASVGIGRSCSHLASRAMMCDAPGGFFPCLFYPA